MTPQTWAHMPRPRPRRNWLAWSVIAAVALIVSGAFAVLADLPPVYMPGPGEDVCMTARC